MNGVPKPRSRLFENESARRLRHWSNRQLLCECLFFGKKQNISVTPEAIEMFVFAMAGGTLSARQARHTSYTRETWDCSLT